ncbi:MAG: hypothetical protein PVG72_08510 [Gammaproteobacteria bacterium]|jgi:hypothetical protein
MSAGILLLRAGSMRVSIARPERRQRRYSSHRDFHVAPVRCTLAAFAGGLSIFHGPG